MNTNEVVIKIIEIMKNGDKKEIFNWVRINNENLFSSNKMLSTFYDENILSRKYPYYLKDYYYTKFNEGIIMVLSFTKSNNKGNKVEVFIQPNISAKIVELPSKKNENMEIKELIEKHINNYEGFIKDIMSL